MTEPTDFTAVVQGPNHPNQAPACFGVLDVPVVVPARVQVLPAGSGAEQQAAELTDGLRGALGQLGSSTAPCRGPCGLGCWAASSPVAHNLLVVVAGPGPEPAPPWVEAEAQAWLDRGFTVLGVVPAWVDPQQVLPAVMRMLVALPYQRSAAETTDEVLDLLLLAGEERRAFVSYAHSDGRQLAQEVFEALAERRFEVYLDRFRTPPATDFVERIDDELRDKTMVVVVETPAAVGSTWVLQEILTAQRRGYGLLAVNVGGQPKHPAISAGRRLTLPSWAGNEDRLVDAVTRQHQDAVVDQRRRRASAVRLALQRASRLAGLPAAQVLSDGDRCDLLAVPTEYTVLSSFRPVRLREARRIAEHAAKTGRRPALYCPRPARPDGRRDLTWLDADTPVAVVPHGRLLAAAQNMLAGTL